MIVHIVFVFQRVSISIGVVARAFALLHHGDWFHGFVDCMKWFLLRKSGR